MNYRHNNSQQNGSTLRRIATGAGISLGAAVLAPEVPAISVLGFSPITKAWYCRTPEQKETHMCEVLGHYARDMKRGRSAIQEHGLAGLVTPATRNPAEIRAIGNDQYLVRVGNPTQQLGDTGSISLKRLVADSTRMPYSALPPSTAPAYLKQNTGR